MITGPVLPGAPLLTGKVALVTGSSRGIGAAIARLFAAHGASVALNGRDRDALERVRATIESLGGRAGIFAADVTTFSELDAARQEAEHALGPLDIVVANAGGNVVPPHQSVEEISEEGWHRSLGLNLTGTFHTLRSVLPGMKARRRGSIVTISSAAARRPTARTPIAYAAAKAGVQLLTQTVAAQVAGSGIRVNCIAPETILTERNAERIPAELQQQLAAEHPVPRLGVPEDVAQAALFLASEMSAWITGVVLDVAGGAVLR